MLAPLGFETIIATGGVATGLDVARAIALGASAAGIARPVLKALTAGGRAGAVAFLEGVLTELRAVMLLTGSRDVNSAPQRPAHPGRRAPAVDRARQPRRVRCKLIGCRLSLRRHPCRLTPPQPAVEYNCLVVEDSPMMRQLLVFALSRVKQLKVTEADDGVDGLRKLAAGKFDIILTDINMPIMDGLKLVKRVRTDPSTRTTPIVVITTESAEEDRQRALSLGANAYITKPIQAPQVIAKVKELLGIDT